MNEQTEEYMFPIRVIQAGVHLVINQPLRLRNTREAKITNRNLQAHSMLTQKPQEMIFTLITEPSEGRLLLLENSEGGEEQRTEIGIGASFTQVLLRHNILLFYIMAYFRL